MMKRAIDRKYRNTIVCIDSYTDKVLKGRMMNPYMEGEIHFASVMDFLLTTETMLENMGFPQAYEEKRVFEKAEAGYRIMQKAPVKSRGEVATFELKVFFRQNASWQGTICWLEKNQEESFRSALELLILLNSALESGKQGT